MDIFVIALDGDLSPRLRQRLGQDLMDHALAFCAEVQYDTAEDVLDPV